MLKRLELAGFKSFADKTEFEFPSGITAIVGPNGSGKSNIVDAVRWVLGEQSAKSLRGGEMADVIFNGSTTRRSLGLAEVTMTFDNSRRVLATDADEVQITRRVYRDGEGEYLINRQLSRLKDIKDLFLGSGAGADAYCIIEQGRVDVLLQASTRDRRTIFEEAAGISRFKAKKTETLRKLERVDQNLQRLQDIVDEVEKQLRSVKLQAAKAQRYQEYSNRLKELRIGIGLREFQQLSDQLQAESATLEGLRGTLDEQAKQAAVWEADTRGLEEALIRLEETAHNYEDLLGQARRQIAAEEATLGHEWSLSADLETELQRTRNHLTELSARVTGLAEAAGQAAKEVCEVDAQCRDQRQILASLEQEFLAAGRRLTALQAQIQADKTEHLEQMRQAARLQNDTVSYKAQVDNLRRERDRLSLKSEQVAEHLAVIDIELKELTEADSELQSRLAAARQTMLDQRAERDRRRQELDDLSQLVADLRAEHRGLTSRVKVLEGLEQSHEGLGTGILEVIGLRDQLEAGPWRSVIGIIAELLTVSREFAPLIDLALGDRAQQFLVSDPAGLARAISSLKASFSGRVTFLPLSSSRGRLAEPSQSVSHESIESDIPEQVFAHEGFVSLASKLVTADDPRLSGLPAQLLHHTIIVRDLESAREMAVHTRGYRFVTLSGELLEADGTLTIGRHHAETSILSRKSELREVRTEVGELEQRITGEERRLVELRDQLAAMDRHLVAHQQEIDVLAEQAADLRSRLNQHRQRREGLHEEVHLSQKELSGLEADIAKLDVSWQQAHDQAQEAERRVQELQARVEEAEWEIHRCELGHQQQQQLCTTAKVALAQVDERLAALDSKHRQLLDDLEQRKQERVQSESNLQSARTRLFESQRTMLRASSALALAYLEKESAERNLGQLSGEREHARQERQQMAERAHSLRNTWLEQQEQAHALELQVSDIRHRRDTLSERIREDYQLDLAELFREAVTASDPSAVADPDTPGPAGSVPVLDPTAVQEEIAELRRKLSRLGSVSLDSLQELAELETRAAELKRQYDDLAGAKRSLEEIIDKINQDSRRLFTDTFQTIRTHFQELFRKLFGGGMAEIVLEDGADILDCGIEIIARPPGKELRSISLMSGGEKTLTAVALLLAIFRSRPSPFCILDEVDAALDEANIGRFTAVLHEFLDRSHFIIITHSKRTMSVADVLYGITMQESGISKRVSVRFEDWPDEKLPEIPEKAAG